MVFLIYFLKTAEAVLTSTHNLCFGSKIRKIGIPLQTPVLLYESGVQGVYMSRTFPDVLRKSEFYSHHRDKGATRRLLNRLNVQMHTVNSL